ncbi:MAG: asparaginase [Candidatus Aenigmatarchaeota archaeon]|nr:MAG: asparaginase [Candidatus Aenigmarchaeota archaeon]
MKITFIQTGGTIDKDYPKPTKGYAFEISEPAVKRILEKVNPNFEFEILSVLRKDSLDITEEDMQKIYNACVKANSDKIIITHGTDTMTETAKKLSGIKDKVIILTGAIRPERFSSSDSDFNIGVAVGAINTLSKGVYIAMQGRVYPWDKVKRNQETGQFV